MNIFDSKKGDISYTSIQTHVTKIIVKHYYKDKRDSSNILYDLFDYEKCLDDLGIIFEDVKVKQVEVYLEANSDLISKLMSEKKKKKNKPKEDSQLSLF